eukprot:10107127-Prorocentrum_lima.AAC.1
MHVAQVVVVLRGAVNFFRIVVEASPSLFCSPLEGGCPFRLWFQGLFLEVLLQTRNKHATMVNLLDTKSGT